MAGPAQHIQADPESSETTRREWPAPDGSSGIKHALDGISGLAQFGRDRARDRGGPQTGSLATRGPLSDLAHVTDPDSDEPTNWDRFVAAHYKIQGGRCSQLDPLDPDNFAFYEQWRLAFVREEITFDDAIEASSKFAAHVKTYPPNHWPTLFALAKNARNDRLERVRDVAARKAREAAMRRGTFREDARELWDGMSEVERSTRLRLATEKCPEAARAVPGWAKLMCILAIEEKLAETNT